jgi:uncharacterized repeat protein (TIGR01451 family)
MSNLAGSVEPGFKNQGGMQGGIMTSRALRIAAILTAAIALSLPCRPGPLPKSTEISLASSTNAMSGRKALPEPISQSRSKSTLQLASNRRKRTLLSGYGRLPIRFEVNQGQADPNVQFISRNRGYSVFLGSSDITLALLTDLSPGGEGFKPRWLPQQRNPRASAHEYKTSVVHVQFLDSNPEVVPQATGELAGKTNYLLGSDPGQWHANVANYGQVEYQNLYPGIDLLFRGQQGQLEFDLVVAPGSDPNLIKLAFPGTPARIDKHGDLVLGAGSEQVTLRKPVIYQTNLHARRLITGAYVLRSSGQLGLKVGAYDRTKTLVIDPSLTYSTYLGGAGDDSANSIAVDSSGNTYIVGQTVSTDFPTASPLQSTSRGHNDVFVAKLNAAGNAMIYSTFLGGSADDFGTGIDVDNAGNAYITGTTESADFPTANAIQSSKAGGQDVFVTKLNHDGTALVYSTFLGGKSADSVSAIALDSAGNAYVAGDTSSADFPTANPLQGSNHGHNDAFVTKINAAGSALVYSTFLGGQSLDIATTLAVDAAGSVYIAGDTDSKDFPTTPGAFDRSCGTNGNCDIDRFYYYFVFDAWVAKINPAGDALDYSTYLGGSADDIALGIAVDSAGNAYVTGQTASTDFPVLNSTQKPKGAIDAFVTKLNPTGSALVYSTLLGGSDSDQGSAIVVDASGNAYVSGITRSTDFPVKNSFQASLGGGADLFITKFDGTGAMVYSTYLGGTGDESETGRSLALDISGDVHLAGSTSSPNFPVRNALQANPAGGMDGFLTKISPADATGTDLSLAMSSSPSTAIVGDKITYTVTASNHGPQDASGVQLTDELPAGLTFVSSSASAGSCTGTGPVICDLGVMAAGSKTSITIIAKVSDPGVLENRATITGDQPDSSLGNNQASVMTTVNADFSVSISPSVQTIAAGQAATYTVTVAALNGPFISDVSLACSGAPKASVCTLSSPTANPGPDPTSPATVTLGITTFPASAGLKPTGARDGMLVSASFLLPGLVLCGLRRKTGRFRKPVFWIGTMVLLVLIGLQFACGGSAANPTNGQGTRSTAPGSYQFEVTGTSGSLKHDASASLMVQ